MKTFKIITFGCRLNQVESREMGEKLVLIGLKSLKNRADLLVINSCCVTLKAEREVRKEIRRVKRENPNCFLVVTGCWVEKIKDLKRKTQNDNLKLKIDLLVENKKKGRIAELLESQLINKKTRTVKRIYKDKYARSKKALIKIQTGCNNFCTYCIVPYVRGRSSSKPTEEIVKEIKRKVEEGIEEVVLTGIDLGDYDDLTGLIKLILTETKVKKISFGSMNIKIFDKGFLRLYQDKHLSSRLSSHFHIPLQSGCEQTLKRMGRKYNISSFKLLIASLKKKIPTFTFSTDVIVGFPGETEKEFEKSLETLKEIKKLLGKRFTKIHTFRFSAREGTVAAKMEKIWGKIDEKKKKSRAVKVARIEKV